MRTLAALTMIAAGAAGCAVILGIDEKPLAEAAEAGVDAGDRCVPHRPPPPTDVNDDDVTRAPFYVATRSYGFDGNLGFDLDDACTYGDASPTCLSRVRRVDQDGGVDNALGQSGFIQALQAAGIENENIACGRSTLVVVIEGYNGRANDTNVLFGPVLSSGIQTPHDGSDLPSECNGKDDAGLPTVYAAKWDGTDQWNIDPPFVQKGETTPIRRLQGYVREWVLVAEAPPDLLLPIPIGPAVVDIAQVKVVATLTPLDAERKPLPLSRETRASFLRIDKAEMAGRISRDAFFRGLHVTYSSRYGFICPNNLAYPAAKSVVCDGLDLMALPSKDGRSENCDAVSAAASFVAEPVGVVGGRTPAVSVASPCADAPTTCP